VATLTFDKLAYVDRLKAAGMGEREARALAEGLDQALREEVATKSDLAAVKADLTAEIAAVETRLVAVEHKLQVGIQTAKHDVLRWMVGMAFAQVGLTVALIRFLPH
jgi:transketolase C-terminal domain/subunit